ncbi:hypothetical protein CGRA01v4_03473 [Colletotrichum graminicola]|nr:hypothetical protein CGRA01v4_03473 [Colletotrichum graminicola]
MVAICGLSRRRTAFLYPPPLCRPRLPSEPPTRGQSRFSFGSSLQGLLSARLPCRIRYSIFSPGTCVLPLAFLS